jgi:hypothetical protein
MRNTRFIFILGLSLVMILTSSLMNDDFLPSKLGPWSLQSDTVYTPENLYDYINGGAELYKSYGFRKAECKRYTAENQPDIIVDIFDMNSSKEAYGVFMYSAEEVSGLVGQGTQYNEGFMLFWMDHYFVSIMAYPENPESREAIMTIARRIENKIGSKGDLPEILDHLPEDGLNELSIRYFHHYAWLNSHYYISSEDILLIGENTDAVLAKYGDSDQHSILLLIDYPSGEKAGEAYTSFIENYLPDLQGNTTLKLEDGSFTGIKQADSLLIIVFNAASGEAAEQLMDASIRSMS